MHTDQADSDLNKVCAAIERLINKLEPTGAYASMIVKDISSPGVHLAFELEGDARRFGAAVNAGNFLANQAWIFRPFSSH